MKCTIITQHSVNFSNISRKKGDIFYLNMIYDACIMEVIKLIEVSDYSV